VLLTRPPLTHLSVSLLQNGSVRLACVRHAASVRSEPGSNSQKELITGAYFLVFKELPANLRVQVSETFFWNRSFGKHLSFPSPGFRY
jgi:hypothetical protein